MKYFLSIMIFLLSNYASIGYTSECYLKFKYEYPEGTILRITAVPGYEYASVFEFGKSPFHQVVSWCDSCIAVLINRANELEREQNVYQHYSGFNVDKQLILVKEGYGYDVLNFQRQNDGSYMIEMNGKLMKKDKRWDLFINLFIKYHLKYKNITNAQFKEILEKSGMLGI